MSRPVRGYDPLSPDSKIDSAALFRSMREACPVHHHVVPDSVREQLNENPYVARPTDQFWSVFRYGDVQEVLQDNESFCSKDGIGPEWMAQLAPDGMLLWADEPAHIRQRQIANKAFLPRMVETRRARIAQFVDDAVDAIAGHGRAEVLADFATKVTTSVIADIVGCAEDRKDDLIRWGNATVEAFGGDADAVAGSFVAMQELFAFLLDRIGERRAMLERGEQPPDDVLTSLIVADYRGSRFSDEELLMACHQLLVAGFETTATAIANGIVLLCEHPGERAKLEADPGLWPTALEEILRYESPVEGMFRVTRRDVELSGCPIPAGSKVRYVLASANRDPARFDEPDEFLVDRDPAKVRQHVAFGSGSHACIGSALARAEARTALETIFRRLPGLHLAGTSPERNPILIINGYRTVHIAWDPAAARPRADGIPAASRA
ncbi:MAG TPA: cytochrome P450 [Pseudonocardia sp.]|nr:cytochrome P450 [Pseudonocardia sp.]